MKTWDISEKAGLLLWEGKGLWLWQFVCGQKANSGASVPYDFYMNKIGDSKSRNKRRCFEEGENTSTTAKNICFNCLPSSLQAVKLFTLGKIRNRRAFQTVLYLFSVFLDRSFLMQPSSEYLLARDTKRNCLHYPFLFMGFSQDKLYHTW